MNKYLFDIQNSYDQPNEYYSHIVSDDEKQIEKIANQLSQSIVDQVSVYKFNNAN